METKEKGQIFKCEICGNIVEVLEVGGGELVCCGKPMQLLVENSVDASLEKHVPIIEKNSEGVLIKIGSIEHPMTEEHYIKWIEIHTENGVGRKFLQPGEKPEAKFPVKLNIISAKAYCNLHGLWKS